MYVSNKAGLPCHILASFYVSLALPQWIKVENPPLLRKHDLKLPLLIY